MTEKDKINEMYLRDLDKARRASGQMKNDAEAVFEKMAGAADELRVRRLKMVSLITAHPPDPSLDEHFKVPLGEMKHYGFALG